MISNISASPNPRECTLTTSLVRTDVSIEPIVTSSCDTTTSISFETNFLYESLFIIEIDLFAPKSFANFADKIFI